MSVDPLFWLVPGASVVALIMAFVFFRQMMAEDEGTDLMRKIAQHVRKGAIAYLQQQYKVVGIVFAVMVVIFSLLAFVLEVQNRWVPVAFLTGGFFSALAGWFGMKTATYASARAAFAASKSLNKGLVVAFRSGAVMGLVVVGLALLDIGAWYLILGSFYPPSEKGNLTTITTTMLTFGMGASLQALFARVGGGIFTKAADVGADLVGKVEAGIPEDDPRNPATIADNVGDNVGDVAGMGADLYESYAGSILATAALGAAAFSFGKYGEASIALQGKAVLAPMLVAAVGTVLSLIGIFAVRVNEGADSKALLGALGRGVWVSSLLIVPASAGVLYYLALPNWLGIWGAMVVGLGTGIFIGQMTEYFTSHAYAPTRRIAEATKTGPATVIIAGLGEGMLSVAYPVIGVVVGTTAAYMFATGGSLALKDMNIGLYGIGMAAVGMLSTLGITLATDAYGPIADNAGGNAEMAGLGPEVRKRTDALDALGNTTAATGKGFAIGSAALTALALVASYIEELKIGILHTLKSAEALYTFPDGSTANRALVEGLDLVAMMNRFEVNLLNPKVIIGLFVGGMMAFVFCGLTMNSVGRAAGKMVDEVRRQFREIEGIMEGKAEPDYAQCVRISTLAAQAEMLVPSLGAIVVPVAVGLVFGVPAVVGLLAGGVATGFALAVFMANSGGAWDNAKKYIEEGHLGGKGSASHKAAVIGDTVGDPFKDTSGPSLNILIKLMTMVAIVMAGVTVSFALL